MLEQNKLLFFILVMIVLVLAFYMRMYDNGPPKAVPAPKTVIIESVWPE